MRESRRGQGGTETADQRQLLGPLRQVSYSDLVARFVDRPAEKLTLVAPRSARYFVEVPGFWDDGKSGPLRVAVSIDDGVWRAYMPLSDDFIKAADESSVDE